MKRIEFKGTIEEAFEHASGLGCVYPNFGHSYAYDSGNDCQINVMCDDGEFYCSYIDDYNKFKDVTKEWCINFDDNEVDELINSIEEL